MALYPWELWIWKEPSEVSFTEIRGVSHWIGVPLREWCNLRLGNSLWQRAIAGGTQLCYQQPILPGDGEGVCWSWKKDQGLTTQHPLW